MVKTSGELTLRRITPEDQGFLYRVYASTREQELAPLDWDDAQKDAFLQMQFNAQHKFYTEQFGNAEFQVILLGGEPVGRLYIDRRKDEVRLIDIALLPEYRSKGTGSALIKDVLEEGRRTGLPVRAHVEQFNPASRLYERLGFHRIGENGVYNLLEWSPFVAQESH